MGKWDNLRAKSDAFQQCLTVKVYAMLKLHEILVILSSYSYSGYISPLYTGDDHPLNRFYKYLHVLHMAQINNTNQHNDGPLLSFYWG